MSSAGPTIDDMISSVIDDKQRADVIKAKIEAEEKTKREAIEHRPYVVAIVALAVLMTSMVAKFAIENVIELRAKGAADLVRASQPPPAEVDCARQCKCPAYRLEPVNSGSSSVP